MSRSIEWWIQQKLNARFVRIHSMWLDAIFSMNNLKVKEQSTCCAVDYWILDVISVLVDTCGHHGWFAWIAKEPISKKSPTERRIQSIQQRIIVPNIMCQVKCIKLKETSIIYMCTVKYIYLNALTVPSPWAIHGKL